MTIWQSGDSLSPSMLNAKLASPSTNAGFSMNTVRAESGNTVSVSARLVSALTTDTSLLVGADSGTATIAPTARLRVGGTAEVVDSLNIGSVSVDPAVVCARANGTLAVPTSALSGNGLGSFNVLAYDGTAYVQGAELEVISRGTWSSGSNGAFVRVRLCPTGSSTLTERLRVDQTGINTLGGAVITANLDVGGGVSSNTMTAQQAAFGTPNGGLKGAGTVNTLTAYYSDGTQVVGTRVTGWTAPTGTATRATFATSTVTLGDLAQAVKALVDDLTTHGLIGT